MTSSTPEDEPERWLYGGTVGSPHGLDGSFHVIRPNPQLLSAGAIVYVAGAPRRIVRRAGTDARPILRLDRSEQRKDAEVLRGETLLRPREDAPPLEMDEWWAEDLEGCRVSDHGRAVGTVRRVLALPSCDVLEVARTEGGELLVPLVGDAVSAVDVEARQIEIDLRFLGDP